MDRQVQSDICPQAIVLQELGPVQVAAVSRLTGQIGREVDINKRDLLIGKRAGHEGLAVELRQAVRECVGCDVSGRFQLGVTTCASLAIAETLMQRANNLAEGQ